MDMAARKISLYLQISAEPSQHGYHSSGQACVASVLFALVHLLSTIYLNIILTLC